MSQGINVLRYSALVFGVFYGLSHQASITSAAKSAHANHEYEHKASLITKAKAEYVKKTAPKESKTESGKPVSDPEDPHFDLEAYLTNAAAEST